MYVSHTRTNSSSLFRFYNLRLPPFLSHSYLYHLRFTDDRNSNTTSSQFSRSMIFHGDALLAAIYVQNTYLVFFFSPTKYFLSSVIHNISIYLRSAFGVDYGKISLSFYFISVCFTLKINSVSHTILVGYIFHVKSITYQ